MKRFLHIISERISDSRISIVLLTSILFIGSYDLYYDFSSAIFWAFICFANALIMVILSQSTNRFIKYCGIAVISLSILLSIVNYISSYFWGFGISGRMLLFFVETNPREVSEFISTISTNILNLIISWRILVVPTICLFSWLTRFIHKSVWISMAWCATLIGICFIGYHWTTNLTGKKNVSIILRTAICIIKSHADINTFARMKSQYSEFLPDESSVSNDGLVDDVIIIMGESSNKTHWSIYGYELATSPHINSLADSMVVFNNVYPPFGSTSECLKNVLTFRNSSTNTKEWYEYANIVQLMKKSGFRTSWLSNQEKIGYQGCTGIISETADYANYVGIVCSGDNDQLKIDNALFPEIDNVLSHQGRHFIFIHTMGSHIIYRSRYPDSFDHFKASDINRPDLDDARRQIISQYDNSILYSDFFINEVIQKAKALNRSSIVLYISDHTDDVYDTNPDFYGHATISNMQISIPLFIWASDKYRMSNQNLWDTMAGNSDKLYSSENLINTILGLCHISYSLYDPSQDLTDSRFQSQPLFFEGKSYTP